MFSLSFFLVNQQDQLLPALLSFNHFHDANNVAYMAIIIVKLISYLSFFSYCFVFLPERPSPSWGGYPALTWSSRPVRSNSHVILFCYPISYSTIFNLSTNTCYPQSSNLLLTPSLQSSNLLTNTLTTIFYLDQLMPE